MFLLKYILLNDVFASYKLLNSTQTEEMKNFKSDL